MTCGELEPYADTMVAGLKEVAETSDVDSTAACAPFLYSAAISLKRIADALESLNPKEK